MAEHACSNFTMKNDYNSEVSSQIIARYPQGISKYHYPTWNIFELEQSIGKSSVGHKVEDLVELARSL